MSKKLSLRLDIDFEPDYEVEDFKQSITELIESNEAEFGDVLGGHCQLADIRAFYIPDSLTVSEIELDNPIYDKDGSIGNELSGYVNVEFEYEAYYGCKDIDGGDVLYDNWGFKLSEGQLIFDLDIPEQRYDDI